MEGRPGFRVAYDGGRIEIMSPSPQHELYGTWVGRLIETMSLELNLDVVGLGSTTFRDAAAAKGLEPDECYYVARADRAREIRGAYDPAVHAPPDLAIEVEFTRKAVAREPIYAALGVPEIWHVTEHGIRCRHLGLGPAYTDARRSLAFPFLEPALLWPWAERLTRERSVSVLREFQRWVRGLG